MSNNPAEPSGAERDQLRDEAATWFARMRGEDAGMHRAAFERWLARGAVHRAAYNRIGEIFAAGKVFREAERRRALRQRAAAVLTGLLVVSVAALAWSGRHGHSTDLAALADKQHVTDVGATQRLQLTNAAVFLDTDTLLVTNVGGSADTIRLDRGRARFGVRGGTRGPAILAGRWRVTSHGGIFDLALGGDGAVKAAAFDGQLWLDPLTGVTADARLLRVRLIAGQRAIGEADGSVRPLADAPQSEWPDHILTFRATPLATVIAQTNRYAVRKIVLADPRLGTRQVSGRFRVDDPERLAARLAAVLSLVVDRSTPGIVLLRAPP